MSGPDVRMSPQAAGDEHLWRTNPVYCVERLLDAWNGTDQGWLRSPARLLALIDGLAGKGVRMPPQALERWHNRGACGLAPGLGRAAGLEYPCPGVVGLVVDNHRADAWIVPLLVERSHEWSADPTLPFRPVTELQDLLLRLLAVLHLPHAKAVPERFAFRFYDMFQRGSVGPSMHVAAVLAAIRAVNSDPTLLARACAVVQTEGDQLAAVASVRPKLEAFIRECGRGTLLVRHAACAEAAAFDEHFDQCWVVASLKDLAQRLEGEGWLKVFLEDLPLGLNDADLVEERLRRLKDAEHRYTEALELSVRSQACGYQSDVSYQRRRHVARAIADLHRHLGHYEEAERLAREELEYLVGSPASSYDDQAQATVNLSAALFDSHQFQQIEAILDTWRERLESHPLIVTPMTRVMVFNTLGRARMVLSADGWEQLILRSAETLSEWEPTELPRTLCYLAHGFLRHGRLEEAREVLRRVEEHPGLNEPSRWFLRFYQAEYARQNGELWASDDLEGALPNSGRMSHPLGFYFQATARQRGRSTDDAVRRFHAAFRFFSQDTCGSELPNIQRFLAVCMSLGEAAWSGDNTLWRDACEALKAQLRLHPGSHLHEYYADALASLGKSADRNAADAFLCRIPYF